MILCFRKPLALLAACLKLFSYLAYSSNPNDGHIPPKYGLTFNRQHSIVSQTTEFLINIVETKNISNKSGSEVLNILA
jgi:hypothetical protein